MYCTRLAENTWRKKSSKIAILALSRNFVGLYLRNYATKVCIDNRKKLKQQYLHMSSQYGELRPTNSWERLASLGHCCKFQRVSGLGFVAAATSLAPGQPNCARSLAVSWAGTLYIWGLFNKFQDSCYILHNNKCLKTMTMLFLNVVSVQFSATFPVLNKLREACSIEIFISTSLCRNFRTCCLTAWSFSNLIPPSDSLEGPNEWKSLGVRSELYGGCVTLNTSQPISAIFCVVWWALWAGTLSWWKITPCWSWSGCFIWIAECSWSESKEV